MNDNDYNEKNDNNNKTNSTTLLNFTQQQPLYVNTHSSANSPKEHRQPKGKKKTWGHSLGILGGVLWDGLLVLGQVELRGSLASHNGQPLLRGRLEVLVVDPAVLVLRLDVQHVLHIKLEHLGAAGPNHAGLLVHLEPPPGCLSEDSIKFSM